MSFRKVIPALAVLALAVFIAAQNLDELDSAKLEPSNPSATSLQQSALAPLTLRHSERGTVRAAFGPMASPVSPKAQRSDPYAAAEAFFRHHGVAFGVDENTTFEPKMFGPSSDGNLVVRFKQRHAGLRVLHTAQWSSSASRRRSCMRCTTSTRPWMSISSPQ